jgi:hypothetical protein
VRDRRPIAREGHNVTFANIKGEVKLFCPVAEVIDIRLKEEAVGRR